MISTPDLAALYDEDIADAAAHIGLNLLSDSYFERQPRHVYAAFVAYGLNNDNPPTLPDEGGWVDGTRNVLAVYFSRGALSVEVAIKSTNRTCAVAWAQHRSYFSTSLGLDRAWPVVPWKKRVATLVQEAVYREIRSYHLDAGVTDILLLGESASAEILGQTVREAVMELQESEPATYLGEADMMEYAASRGAAEMAWEVLKRPPLGGNSTLSSEECSAEQRRKYENSIHYFLEVKEQLAENTQEWPGWEELQVEL